MAPLLSLTMLACAPVEMTPERAERICREDVGLADGVGGYVGVGVGSDGGRARGGITVTNAILNPQTEAEFLRDCVARTLNGEPRPVTVGISIGGRA